MTEQEKKDAGLWYDAHYDPNIRDTLFRAKELAFKFNKTNPLNRKKQRKILKKLLHSIHKTTTILSPFYCDYGYNITIGKHSFLNHDVYLMDCGKITIGNHVLIGPSSGLYTATHAFVPEERNLGLEKTGAITIEDNVWLGGNVTVLPGVTIHEGSIIGAKSLVNSDIPPNVIAAGNPCKVIREITEADRLDPDIINTYKKQD